MRYLLAITALVLALATPTTASAHLDRDWFAGVVCGPDHNGMSMQGWWWYASCTLDWDAYFASGGYHEHYYWTVDWV